VLVSDVERLKQFGRFKQHAEEVLGLRECPPDRSDRVQVSARAVERWRGIDAEVLSPRQVPEVEESLLALLSDGMMTWTRSSMARESEDLQGR
jgi:hypothetical protein